MKGASQPLIKANFECLAMPLFAGFALILLRFVCIACTGIFENENMSE